MPPITDPTLDTLHAWLTQEPAVLVSVRSTQGSVPREAGTWMEALQDDETAVIASSSADVNGSDCAGGIRPSAFGDVFFGSAMRQSDDLEHAVELARNQLAERKAPRPVMSIGASICSCLTISIV